MVKVLTTSKQVHFIDKYRGDPNKFGESANRAVRKFGNLAYIVYQGGWFYKVDKNEWEKVNT